MARIDPPRAPNLPPEVVPLRARQFRWPRTFAALRHRNYRVFLISQVVSMAGTWMGMIAQGWLVYQLSGSELALGIVGFAGALPALMVAPWGGVLADRVSKRSLLFATQCGAMLVAFALAYLTFTGQVEVWHVVALAAVLGAVNGLDSPVRQAFVVELVGKEDLPNAIALNSMTFNSARIIGPALGGLVLVLFGAAWCFLLNGLTFTSVMLGLLAMRLPARTPSVDISSPLAQLKGGLRYVAESPNLKSLLLLALVFSLFGISYSTVLPAFVAKVLGQGPDAFGAINAASGVGAVTTAFLIARYGERGRRGQWLAIGAITFPVVLILFAVTQHYYTSLVLAGLLGMGFMAVFTLINTLLQTSVADAMRGRVLSLYTLTFFGFTPFGNLLIGSLSEVLGLSLALTLSALLCLGLQLYIFVRTPSLRAMA
ncbi:MAG: MFS transporter [Litorilinea sp.]